MSEQRLIDANALMEQFAEMQKVKPDKDGREYACNFLNMGGEPSAEWFAVEDAVENAPTVDAVPVPGGGIGEISDGYHTFNGLYYQRLILFAVIVKTYKDKAWKSRRHEDGKLCFGGGWFVVGIDTPQGSYTYHYEDKYFDLFDCEELPNGKEWDGHTEVDVTRLLTLCAGKERSEHEAD